MFCAAPKLSQEHLLSTSVPTLVGKFQTQTYCWVNTLLWYIQQASPKTKQNICIGKFVITTSCLQKWVFVCVYIRVRTCSLVFRQRLGVLWINIFILFRYGRTRSQIVETYIVATTPKSKWTCLAILWLVTATDLSGITIEWKIWVIMGVCFDFIFHLQLNLTIK